MVLQSKGGQKLRKINHSTLQRPILKHPESYFYVVFLLLKFRNDLYNFRWRFYSILNRLK
jgi:hypothetical protein